MIIHSLTPRNFRNLAPDTLEFSPRVNFVSGGNGQGKTNLLEALHWLVALRGKRGTVAECTRKGETGFQLEGELTFGELKHRVGFTVEGRSRKLLVDDTPPRRRRDYLEQVLVVDFFPEDLLILLMQPALRRRFIDLACVQYSLPHEDVLRRFKRLLEQRNSLLKNEGGPDISVLESFDVPLSDAAAQVTSARLHLLSKLGEQTNSIFREGIGESYQADLNYLPANSDIPCRVEVDHLPDPEPFREVYLEALRLGREKDIQASRTTVGPHRDDWGMTLDGKDVRSYASRGEVRSALFALHLARFRVLTEKRGIRPVVLIDDVMSELDSSRRVRVLELLPPGQVFLTACDPPPEIDRFRDGDFAHFAMEAGKAKRIE